MSAEAFGADYSLVDDGWMRDFFLVFRGWTHTAVLGEGDRKPMMRSPPLTVGQIGPVPWALLFEHLQEVAAIIGFQERFGEGA